MPILTGAYLPPPMVGTKLSMPKALALVAPAMTVLTTSHAKYMSSRTVKLPVVAFINNGTRPVILLSKTEGYIAYIIFKVVKLLLALLTIPGFGKAIVITS